MTDYSKIEREIDTLGPTAEAEACCAMRELAYFLLDVAKAAEEMAADYEAYEYQRDTKDYSQPIHDPDILAKYETALTALQEHCDECNQR